MRSGFSRSAALAATVDTANGRVKIGSNRRSAYSDRNSSSEETSTPFGDQPVSEHRKKRTSETVGMSRSDPDTIRITPVRMISAYVFSGICSVDVCSTIGADCCARGSAWAMTMTANAIRIALEIPLRLRLPIIRSVMLVAGRARLDELVVERRDRFDVLGLGRLHRGGAGVEQ